MDQQAVFANKNNNLMKALSRQGCEYVPNIIYCSTATLGYAGKTLRDVFHDPHSFAENATAVFQDMWADGQFMLGTLQSPFMQDVFDPIQNRFGEDGLTLEHIQLSPMKADEYDKLIADPNGFLVNELLPRRYPKLFADRDWAKNALKFYAQEQALIFMNLPNVAAENERRNGVTNLINVGEVILNPADALFDTFRGFKGTLLDARRQPANMKAAIDKLWEVRFSAKLNTPMQKNFPFAPQFPHIAPYLSPMQFDEMYWPYEKQLLERVANAGGKAIISMEGRWEKVWHHFLELPKDSCILLIDDDDVVDAYKALGHWQIIGGGLKLGSTRTHTKEQIHDEIKRVMDICAPDGGFLFCTDKAWISGSDMNENLIDAYNFAHEYSKR